jgi:Na+/melibiose symporter-like transporter
VTNIAKCVAQAAPPVLVTVIMLTVDQVRGVGNTTDAAYYLINVSVISAMGVLFMVLLAGAKPAGVRQKTVDLQQASATIGQMLNDLRKNKNVLIVFLINVLGFARNMSNVILLQANGALIGKVELFGRTFDTTTDTTWLPYLFGNISAAAALVLVPLINRRLKEKKELISCFLFWISFSACGVHVLCAAGRGQPRALWNQRHVYDHGLLFFMVFSFIGSFLMGVNQFIPLAMTAEISRFESEQNGLSYASAPYAVLTMSVKLGTALSTVIGLLIVSAGGYNQLVYQAGQITPHMQNIVMFAFKAIPGISTLLSAVPAFFYPLPVHGSK